MNEAKKLLLVDPQTLSRLHTPIPATHSIDDLDQAMGSILSMKGLSDRDKWTLYNQQLQKYFHRLGEARKPIEIPVQSESQPQPVDDDDDPSSADLSSRLDRELPKKYRTKAKGLYHFLSQLPDLSWDHTGTVSIRHRPISGSNLIDLVGDLMRERKNYDPVGYVEFLRFLKSVNIPRELVGNLLRWKQMQEGSGSRPPALNWERIRL